MKPDDPAYWMLSDGVTSTPTVFKAGCYICEDPEFARMGLPLCYKCIVCSGHVAADDDVCENGHRQPIDPWDEFQVRLKHGLEIPVELLEAIKED